MISTISTSIIWVFYFYFQFIKIIINNSSKTVIKIKFLMLNIYLNI